MDRERECIRCGGYVSRSNYTNRLCYDCDKDLGRSSSSSTTSYVYVDDREWWEKGWVWFWLIVCWPIGYYGLYKRYPKTMIRLGIVIIVLFVLSRIVEFFKGLFD